jgi:tetratricopeptide (TPR) repeat protein
MPLADIRRIQNYVHEAEALARSLGDQERLSAVASANTFLAFGAGEYHRIFETAQAILPAAEALGDVPTQVRLRFELGRAHVARGEFREAIEHYSRCPAIVAAERAYERHRQVVLPSVTYRTWLIMALAERGEFTAAIEVGKDARQIVEAPVQPVDVLTAYWGSGHAHLRRGDLGTAIALLERGLAAGQ